MLGYREHPVDPRLAPFVACYWTHETGGDERGSYPVMPDGCIDLLFESGARRLTVVGTMTRTFWPDLCGPTQLLGVRFRPGGAVPFLRERADLLTDDVVDASAILGAPGGELTRRLGDGRCVVQRVRQVERHLLRWWQRRSPQVECRVAWASAQLGHDPAQPLAGLAQQLGVSRQHLRRLFLHHTGLAPKAFARVARLRQLVSLLDEPVGLAAAAAVSGYTDQAHMTREFKRLVGMTPGRYRARRRVPFVQDGRAGPAYDVGYGQQTE